MRIHKDKKRAINLIFNQFNLELELIIFKKSRDTKMIISTLCLIKKVEILLDYLQGINK